MRLNTLTIAVTNEYDPEYNIAGPRETLRLTMEQVRSLVDQAAALGVSLLTFSGGEPFLLGKTLEQMVTYAAFRIPRVRVVTDCYWANTAQDALLKVALMYQAGLSEIDIRYSDWNQSPKWIQWAKWVHLAAEQAGLTVLSHHFWDREKHGFHIAHSEAHPADAKAAYADGLESGILTGELHPVSLLYDNPQRGRTQDVEALLFQRQAEGQNCPYIFRTITAQPDGRLSACGGCACSAPDLNLGDWRTAAVANLMDAGRRDPLLQWISLRGPEALRRFIDAESPDSVPPGDYASRCHLCKDLLTTPKSRRAIRGNAGHAAQEAIAGEIAELKRIKGLLFNADARPDSF
ncbi:MAG TPA: hypothetical protein VLZ81_00230 [Blastocatellia bacterium]|nr:hypothetical protein [Blastocatellia bacterium]